jgi:hypothetical protein
MDSLLALSVSADNFFSNLLPQDADMTVVYEDQYSDLAGISKVWRV